MLWKGNQFLLQLWQPSCNCSYKPGVIRDHEKNTGVLQLLINFYLHAARSVIIFTSGERTWGKTLEQPKISIRVCVCTTINDYQLMNCFPWYIMMQDTVICFFKSSLSLLIRLELIKIMFIEGYNLKDEKFWNRICVHYSL